MPIRHPGRGAGLADIRRYFDQPRPRHLGLEPAVCWILECLLQADSYPSALVQDLMRRYPQLRLSETVLQQAISFLQRQAAIESYSQRCPSRGRPRRMLHLCEAYRGEAEQLMPTWQRWREETREAPEVAGLWPGAVVGGP